MTASHQTAPLPPILEPRPDAVSAALAGEILNARMVKIGTRGRSFPMVEMTALNFAALVELVVDEAQGWIKEGIISDKDLRVQINDLMALIPLILKLLRRAQEFFGKAIILIFGIDNPDDGAYIVKNITVKQVSDVIIAFMETNSWEDLVANFRLVGQSFQPVLQRLNPGRDTSSASSGTSSAPDSEATPPAA